MSDDIKALSTRELDRLALQTDAGILLINYRIQMRFSGRERFFQRKFICALYASKPDTALVHDEAWPRQ